MSKRHWVCCLCPINLELLRKDDECDYHINRHDISLFLVYACLCTLYLSNMDISNLCVVSLVRLLVHYQKLPRNHCLFVLFFSPALSMSFCTLLVCAALLFCAAQPSHRPRSQPTTIQPAVLRTNPRYRTPTLPSTNKMASSRKDRMTKQMCSPQLT